MAYRFCFTSLTPAVVEEALATPTSFIVSYHPPIFKPLTSLTLSNPLQASLLRCAAAGISVYTPHSALDSVTEGLNDWLCERIAGPLRGITWSSGYIGPPFPEELGGVGRIITFKEPMELKMLEFKVRSELELKQGGLPCLYRLKEARLTTAMGKQCKWRMQSLSGSKP